MIGQRSNSLDESELNKNQDMEQEEDDSYILTLMLYQQIKTL